MAAAPLRIRDGGRREKGFLLEGMLECAAPDCGARYPVLEGVPVVLKDVGGWWRGGRTALTEVRSGDAGVRGYFHALDGAGPAALERKAFLGSYMDFHYADLASPREAPPSRHDALNALYWESAAGLARRAEGERDPLSVDLGCSAGRYTFALAESSGLAVGLDADFGMAAGAARIQRNRKVAYERRERGRRYVSVEAAWDAPQNVLFLVGDALDPPFSAAAIDLVGALNLLDNVGVPLTLLGQMDALLKEGGRMVVGTPFEWRTEIADPSEWLETDRIDGPALVRGILEGSAMEEAGFRYSIEGEIGELPWALRGHSRRSTHFLSYVVAARKLAGAERRAV